MVLTFLLCLNVKIFVLGLFQNPGKRAKLRFEVVEEQPHYTQQACTVILYEVEIKAREKLRARRNKEHGGGKKNE